MAEESNTQGGRTLFPNRPQQPPQTTKQLPQAGSEPNPASGPIVGQSQELVDKAAQGQTGESDEQLNTKANEALDEAKDKLAEGNRVEAYGKHGSQDENTPLSQTTQLEELDEGAVDLSQQPGTTMLRTESRQQIEAAANTPQEATMFSSHPISGFKVGRFQFVNGQLTLTGDDVAEFEKLLEKLPVRDRSRVRKIDRAAAERAAERFLTKRVRGVDTAGSSR
jgi:hypothetical protein